MQRQRSLWITMLFTALLTFGHSETSKAQQQGGPAERVGGVVGEALDNTGRAIERGFRTAFARTRGVVEKMELSARVYSRLHWDKMLASSRLDLEVHPGGVTVLRGVVPNAEAELKAVTLAAETIGVTRVVNQLTVLEPPAEPLSNEVSPLTSPIPSSSPDSRPSPSPIPIEPPDSEPILIEPPMPLPPQP